MQNRPVDSRNHRKPPNFLSELWRFAHESNLIKEQNGPTDCERATVYVSLKSRRAAHDKVTSQFCYGPRIFPLLAPLYRLALRIPFFSTRLQNKPEKLEHFEKPDQMSLLSSRLTDN